MELISTALAHSHDIQGRRKSARREDGTLWTYDYNDRSEVTGAEKRQSNSELVPGLDFGYDYDGLGNRLTASKGLPALVTESEPDAMNRHSTITSPAEDDILVRSDTQVDVEVDEEPVEVFTSCNFHSATITGDNSTSPAFPEITICLRPDLRQESFQPCSQKQNPKPRPQRQENSSFSAGCDPARPARRSRSG
jgi:hypothetical protein